MEKILVTNDEGQKIEYFTYIGDPKLVSST